MIGDKENRGQLRKELLETPSILVMEPPKPEMVDHPSHYGGKGNPYEVVKVMEAWLTPEEFRGAMKFNIHKYLARAGKKGNPDEDAAKAAWYAQYLDGYNKQLAAEGQAEEKLK